MRLTCYKSCVLFLRTLDILVLQLPWKDNIVLNQETFVFLYTPGLCRPTNTGCIQVSQSLFLSSTLLSLSLSLFSHLFIYLFISLMVFYTDCITFSLLFSSRVKQVWHKRLLRWGRMWTSWGPPFPWNSNITLPRGTEIYECVCGTYHRPSPFNSRTIDHGPDIPFTIIKLIILILDTCCYYFTAHVHYKLPEFLCSQEKFYCTSKEQCRTPFPPPYSLRLSPPIKPFF